MWISLIVAKRTSKKLKTRKIIGLFSVYREEKKVEKFVTRFIIKTTPSINKYNLMRMFCVIQQARLT